MFAVYLWLLQSHREILVGFMGCVSLRVIDYAYVLVVRFRVGEVELSVNLLS